MEPGVVARDGNDEKLPLPYDPRRNGELPQKEERVGSLGDEQEQRRALVLQVGRDDKVGDERCDK